MPRKQIKNGEWTGKWVADKTRGRNANGERARVIRVVDTFEEAQAVEEMFLRGKEGEVGAVVDAASDRMRFRDFVDQVFWPMKEGLAENTKKGYARDIKLRLMPEFGDTALGDINSYRIQKMISSCASRKVARNAKETLSAILSCACGLRILDFNPANYRASNIKYSYPPASGREGTMYGEWLTDYASQYRLLKYVEDEYPGELEERIVVLGLCFGLRPEEGPALDWERVDFETGGIWVKQAACAVGGSSLVETKNKKERFVPMSAWARRRMSEWRRCATPSRDFWGNEAHPVLTTSALARASLKTCQGRMRRLREKGSYADGAPFPQVTSESLRHSFASSAIRDGVPIPTVSAWLGHENVSTTMNRYCKSRADDIMGDIGYIDLAMERARAAAEGAQGNPAAAIPPREDGELVRAVKGLLFDFAVAVESGGNMSSADIGSVAEDYARAVVVMAGARR